MEYCQDRADKTKEHLWLTGTWLITIIAAAIALPFTAKLIEVTNDKFILDVKYPIPTFFLGLFGSLLSVYSYFVITDLGDHMNRCWNRADYLSKGEFKDNTSTTAGQVVLYCTLSLLLVAALSLMVIAVLKQ